MSTSSDLRQALRDALPGAMNDRDDPARSAIREALAAIETAEAVADPGQSDRRELDDEHILEIVTAERDAWLTSAADARREGNVRQAEEMEAEAAALDAFLC